LAYQYELDFKQRAATNTHEATHSQVTEQQSHTGKPSSAR
jgi:hypothetical protein